MADTVLRRAAIGLLTAVLIAGAAGCDALGGGRDSSARPRVERTAGNPPPGLPAALTTGQRLKWSACREPSAARDDGYECATMRAPLDYRRPDRDTIAVAMIRKRATGPEEKRIGSLLFNWGGPGMSGVTELPGFARSYTALNERYDLVSFDPRGVARTIPVRCGTKEYEGAAGCRKHSGRLLRYVSTAHTARDMDLMRYLLGDERLHYFGSSYGTQLGGQYAHLFPGHVGRLVLEAPVDPTRDRLTRRIDMVVAVRRAFDRFTAHCAAAYRDCPTGSDAGQADQRVLALLRRLKKHPAPTGESEKLDDGDAARGIANSLDRGKRGWPELADALRQVMEEGKGDKLYERAYDITPGAQERPGLAAAAAAAPASGPAKVVDNGVSAHAAISCADSSLRPDLTETEEMTDRIEAASPIFGEALSGTVYLCYEWPVAGESTTPDVSAAGARPILVVGGTGDPTTPYEGAGRMVRELGEGVGTLLTVHAEGHGTYPENRCAVRHVQKYLFTGTAPRDGTRCG